ncbi:hypothetical protein Trydic_g881 [Trypoxylus dichotomus]
MVIIRLKHRALGEISSVSMYSSLDPYERCSTSEPHQMILRPPAAFQRYYGTNHSSTFCNVQLTIDLQPFDLQVRESGTEPTLYSQFRESGLLS